MEDAKILFQANGFLPRAINDAEMAELLELVSSRGWKLVVELFQLRADKHARQALQLNIDDNIRRENIVRYNACLPIIQFASNLKEEFDKGGEVISD